MEKELENKIKILNENIDAKPMLCIQYLGDFKAINRNLIAMGIFAGFDENMESLLLTNGLSVPLSDIVCLESDIFKDKL